MSFTRTLGGERKAFVRKGGRRSWSIDVGIARPDEVSTIETVARSLSAIGWYGAEAVVGNLVSPQSSGFDDATANASDGGLVALPNGQVARSVVHTGSASVTLGAGLSRERIPVRPGTPMTVGAWATGALRISGIWLDAAGTSLSSFTTPLWGQLVNWEWREYTLTPPLGAASFTFNLNDGAQYASPSASWGAVGRQELGTGCPAALVHSPSHAPVALWQGANYTDSSFTVTEVG